MTFESVTALCLSTNAATNTLFVKIVTFNSVIY